MKDTHEIEVQKMCYVCGFPLEDQPYYLDSHPIANHEIICPCCGTHYGLDDEGAGNVEIPDELVDDYKTFGDEAHKKIIKILRQNWIDNGMKWWAEEDPFGRKPENWDPVKQLENVPEEFK